jgi:DNA adenine methylase
MVVLSAYEHEVYDNMLSGWLKVSKKTYADGASPRSEVLWLNPKAADRQKTKLLFS